MSSLSAPSSSDRSCATCGQNFTSPWQLRRHVARKNSCAQPNPTRTGIPVFRRNEPSGGPAPGAGAPPAGLPSEPRPATVAPAGVAAAGSLGSIAAVPTSAFGKENLDRVPRPAIFRILRSLGEVGTAGQNLPTICGRAILQTAMIVFSDPEHPEDITCFLPANEGETALVHGERGWEVRPVGLVAMLMASQAAEALFRNRPVPEGDMPQHDMKWVTLECSRIMCYLAAHELPLISGPVRGEMLRILARNRDLLARGRAPPSAGEA